ncbi:endonuclease KNAG_0M00740 [Huiozyma naganishii CBS 8797]|uniref:GIY-YIG domain-containing protein n=1 Tax=Huiozyma naganishii (strain ATCC MYA-139 / BCRC 22969 / CBS 8797 / KCTC 17520 / NBRC 10181 / NCYC 3082 / Yp74L-3) TaxID=1071383 RepID=J7S401_HUIN7|nr:hypothetical protein KNAG_0M00740 [Kazachstania naganishii CBS 8797]CCK72927.1 hypothetical protein KNAG_0M00740 [Kazachstania naganishii CBS 8797]
MNELCPFYCCYLLQSVNKRQSFYVGSTPNPYKRLRQHNGSLVHGGAYRTKRLGARPWEMVGIVYGFPSRIAALQFEHALQHVYQTHYIPDNERIVKNKQGGKTLPQKLSSIRQLLKCHYFHLMSVKVHFFNAHVSEVWMDNKFKVEADNVMTVSEGALHHIDPAKSTIDDVLDYASANQRLVEKFYNDYMKEHDKTLDRYLDKLTTGSLACTLCDSTFDYTSDDVSLKPFVAFCKHCNGVSHLRCLYDKFLNDEGSESLVPERGICPSCQEINAWSETVLYAKTIKKQHSH